MSLRTQAQTITDGGWVIDGTPDDHPTTETDFAFVGKLTIDATPGIFRLYMAFDLSSHFTRTPLVVAARLIFKLPNVPFEFFDAEFAPKIRRLTHSFDGLPVGTGSVTWNSRGDGLGTWDNPGGDFDNTHAVTSAPIVNPDPATSTTVTLQIGLLVQDALNQTVNQVRLMMTGTESGSDNIFMVPYRIGGDSGNTEDDVPRLEIDYTRITRDGRLEGGMQTLTARLG